MKYFISLMLLCTLGLSSCSKEGKKLPELSFTTLDGTSYTSSDLQGRVVVLNVWASWCGTCIQELPVLHQLTADFPDRDKVLFIAFSDEEEALVRSFLGHLSFPYQHVAEASSITSKLKSRLVKTYPQNIVVGKDGKVVYDASDAQKDLYKTMKSSIQSALEK